MSYTDAEMVALDRVMTRRFLAAEFRRNHPEYFPEAVRPDDFKRVLDEADRSASANRFNP